MRRFVWMMIVAFLAGVLVLGCGKPEEPKAKKPAEPAVSEKK